MENCPKRAKIDSVVLNLTPSKNIHNSKFKYHIYFDFEFDNTQQYFKFKLS